MWTLRGIIFNNSSHFKGLINTMENEWKIYDGLDKENKFYDWTKNTKEANRGMQGRGYGVVCVIYSRGSPNDTY